jgi:hypothetical protein
VASETPSPAPETAEPEKRENDAVDDVESAEPATKKFKPDDQPEAVATAVV